ncbi:MAG: helix-turn-helix transcriptional regulator, partial [Clostridia bacterium]|nr:helix-turn-helix transcriptional regulator [Clostridia bacterium]
LILPLEPHEYPGSENTDAQSLTLMLGPNFLGEYYKPFIHSAFETVYSLKTDAPPESTTLMHLFEEIFHLREHPTEFSTLKIHGNLYQISALMLEHLPIQQSKNIHTKNLQDLSKIEKALEIIHQDYAEPLSIDAVSHICGYSKSNFCTIFKNITGATFHSALNQQRIEIACLHLQSSDLTIEEISEKVGFTDTKSFCRVFKKILGITAGEYRKKHRAPAL